MPRILYPFFRLTTHYFCLLIFYFLFRAGFYIFNISSFPGINFYTLGALFFYGARFDISAILAINSLFLLLFLLPFDTLKYQAYQKFLQILFVSVNAIALLLEVADWMYFPFNHKRSTFEIFGMISRKGDFLFILPSFLKDYWYAFIIAAILIYFLYKSYVLIERYFKKHYKPFILKKNLSGKKRKFFIFSERLLILLCGIGLSIIGIRGGLQYKPIGMRNAAEIEKAAYSPIALNTSFSIIHSISNNRLQPLHFMSDDEAMRLIQPLKEYKHNLPFLKKNVVVIILESFSKEFTGLGPGKSYTPFLDSLMEHSLTFTNAFSNGLHSAEGIPTIISGIPSLMDESFTSSVYSTNTISALPSILAQEGYFSAFYHGATNGSMNFDVFAKLAGYDRYFGRTEYNNEKDYDGNWGIFDEPFFQYFAKGLSIFHQPFFASIFSLTSHPPYPIPKKYKNKFVNDGLAIHPCIEYTDFALKEFFDSIKNKEWYKNTLFVITPDHCSPLSSSSYYANNTGRYQIPIIFFSPGDSALKGYNSMLMDQMDILPSVLDYLHYPKPFFAFGNSVFQPAATRFVIDQLNETYYWINDGNQMEIVNGKPREVYAFPADSMKKNNLMEHPNYKIDSSSFKLWEAFVQVYDEALVNNEMTAKQKLYANDKAKK